MESTHRWLSCEQIVRGNFKDEVVIIVKLRDGSIVSYFVPAEDVERNEKKVRVSVRDSGEITWATLPTSEPVTIPIERTSLVPA
ncbi:MAG: hypothetical protein HY286_18240 [Planctomycetes bacterium]|nr:hypothetical protein [Planctomycetota bacterium]